MSDAPHEPRSGPQLIDLPVRDVIAQVADTSHNSGGGVIAGMTLAGAAAAAELVLRLAARRKSLAPHRAEIVGLVDAVEAHRRSFEDAADRDAAAFTALVNAQREAKQLKETDEDAAHSSLQLAYVQAAEAPLSLCREATAFMQLVEQGLAFASRFTVSDLGAAAALARGGIDAALLTIEANLAYVEEERAAPLRGEVSQIRMESADIADRVLERAKAAIAGGKGGS